MGIIYKSLYRVERPLWGPCAWRLTQLGFLGHLRLVDDVAQDLLLLQQLVLVQRLLLAEVVVVLLLVLLQFVQRPLQRPGERHGQI